VFRQSILLSSSGQSHGVVTHTTIQICDVKITSKVLGLYEQRLYTLSLRLNTQVEMEFFSSRMLYVQNLFQMTLILS
jgi:hypothetical protein